MNRADETLQLPSLLHGGVSDYHPSAVTPNREESEFLRRVKHNSKISKTGAEILQTQQ